MGSECVKFKPNPFTCIWHGLTLSGLKRLLTTRPPIHWSRLHKVAPILPLCILNSIAGIRESIWYGKQIQQQSIQHPPIFILGHWRSGTTLLHNLITLDSQFTFPNLYQVSCPGHFLMTESRIAPLMGWTIPKTRPMDNMEMGFHLPQEDELALLLLSGLSPYLLLAHPTGSLKFDQYYDFTSVSEVDRNRWKQQFIYFAKKLTIKENKPIVYKSPTHTFRIPLLLEMFPKARFIYIYRDPYAVFISTLHVMKTMYSEHALSTFESDRVLEERALPTYTKCMETYERTRGLVPSQNIYEVRFEDLEADPLGQMRRVYQALNLEGWSNLEPVITKKLPELKRYRKNSFQMDEDLMRKVYRHWKPSFDRYGYPSRLPETEITAKKSSN